MVDISEISGALKTRRHEMGISLEDAASKLNIRSRDIEAIESGVLPSGLYAKGFIKGYAGILELDGDELLAKAYSGPGSGEDIQVEKLVQPQGLSYLDPGELRPSPRLMVVCVFLTCVIYLSWLYARDLNKMASMYVVDKPLALQSWAFAEVLFNSASLSDYGYILVARADVEIRVSGQGGDGVLSEALGEGEAYFLPGDSFVSVSSDKPWLIDVFTGEGGKEHLGELSVFIKQKIDWTVLNF